MKQNIKLVELSQMKEKKNNQFVLKNSDDPFLKNKVVFSRLLPAFIF